MFQSGGDDRFLLFLVAFLQTFVLLLQFIAISSDTKFGTTLFWLLYDVIVVSLSVAAST